MRPPGLGIVFGDKKIKLSLLSLTPDRKVAKIVTGQVSREGLHVGFYRYRTPESFQKKNNEVSKEKSFSASFSDWKRVENNSFKTPYPSFNSSKDFSSESASYKTENLPGALEAGAAHVRKLESTLSEHHMELERLRQELKSKIKIEKDKIESLTFRLKTYQEKSEELQNLLTKKESAILELERNHSRDRAEVYKWETMAREEAGRVKELKNLLEDIQTHKISDQNKLIQDLQKKNEEFSKYTKHIHAEMSGLREKEAKARSDASAYHKAWKELVQREKQADLIDKKNEELNARLLAISGECEKRISESQNEHDRSLAHLKIEVKRLKELVDEKEKTIRLQETRMRETLIDQYKKDKDLNKYAIEIDTLKQKDAEIQKIKVENERLKNEIVGRIEETDGIRKEVSRKDAEIQKIRQESTLFDEEILREILSMKETEVFLVRELKVGLRQIPKDKRGLFDKFYKEIIVNWNRIKQIYNEQGFNKNEKKKALIANSGDEIHPCSPPDKNDKLSKKMMESFFDGPSANC